MKTFELPKSISSLVDELQIVKMIWQGIPLQIPKFAVYAIITKPLFDRIVYTNGRQISLMNVGRYQVPILDPLSSGIDLQPNFALIISHCCGNRFGLYGYPADHIESNILLSASHSSVTKIVQEYI